jgi:hypothetical protein
MNFKDALRIVYPDRIPEREDIIEVHNPNDPHDSPTYLMKCDSCDWDGKSEDGETCIHCNGKIYLDYDPKEEAKTP